MFIFYDIVFFVCAVVYLPFLLWKGKWHDGFYMRLGISSLRWLKDEIDGKKSIWVHAVSVGEVLAVLDLIEEIQRKFAEYKIILSTVTPAGHELARARLKNKCLVIFAPVDFSWAVRKYAEVIRPQIYIGAETEIWPNLYLCLNKRGVPIVQVNGRISDKAFKGYRRINILTKNVLRAVHTFCMQSPRDAERIISLGADPGRVYVAGNLKFDNLPQAGFARQEDWGFAPEDKLFIAGSTHPGEEGILIDVFKRLSRDVPQLRLVLAPRHVERARDVLRLAGQSGLKAVRFSECDKTTRVDGRVVVVDTIGHLRDLYGLAEIVFIGKTLAVGGGQNMIEPLNFGKPTFVGPYTENFKDITRIFVEAGALIQVSGKEELLPRLRALLKDPDRMREMGASAKKVIRNHQGATAKTMDVISGVLEK
jgi:3-deoxy-D-manno-octulosonic-acid transferase